MTDRGITVNGSSHAAIIYLSHVELSASHSLILILCIKHQFIDNSISHHEMPNGRNVEGFMKI